MNTAIIGGDRRMLYAAQAFMQEGDDVVLCGFDMTELPQGLRSLPLSQALAGRDILVLPVRPVSDGHISAPYAEEPIPIAQLAEASDQTPVFTGAAGSVAPYLRGKVYDYASREDFAVRNAVLTAEGAVGMLIREWDDAIFGAEILVLGYGRIGRVLSRYLKALGAQVTVAARREASRAWAQAEGLMTCDDSFKEIYRMKVVINTVPAPVLTAEHIDRLRPDALIMELASSPGGVDESRAEERGVRLIKAPSLPGRSAPAAAGRIIKDTIRMIIKEDNGGKDHSGLRDDRLLLHL